MTSSSVGLAAKGQGQRRDAPPKQGGISTLSPASASESNQGSGLWHFDAFMLAPMVEGHEAELRKEGSAMALYVSVCLLAALIALDEDANQGHVRAFGLIWGTTIGLAVAHAFAFRVSAQVAAGGELDRKDSEIVRAQLAGAAFVGLLCTVPVVLLPSTGEFDVARSVLSAFIAAMGYSVARLNGASRTRSLIFGGVILTVAVAIALLKNVLSGH